MHTSLSRSRLSLQQTIIKKHRDEKTFLPEAMVRSSMWQMLNGLHYIHSNWVIHRDMKPSNVMVMGTDSMCPGQVKIGGLLCPNCSLCARASRQSLTDFGLARVFRDPPTSLDENGVVVTIWYRAPELLLMSKHYTPAIGLSFLSSFFRLPSPCF